MATKPAAKKAAQADKNTGSGTARPAVPRARIAVEPVQDAPGVVASEEGTTEIEDDDMVTALVPRKFKLTLDNHHTIDIHAGTQDMPRSHAEHWFAKNMGVEIYGE